MRRDLIGAEETEQGNEIVCPFYTWECLDGSEGPRPPAHMISSVCIWNLAVNASPQGEANLLSLVNMGNTLRSMGKQDQDRYKFQMIRILSISRLLESRCQSLFIGLIEAKR